MYQLPPQDNEARYCHNLTEEEKKEFYTFSTERMKEFLGRGVVRVVSSVTSCKNCKEILSIGGLCIVAPRAGLTDCWHPACFTCTVCNELLMDLIYCFDNNEIYCGRHHAEVIKPRCSACDELILTEECTEAEGRTWHIKHFACLNCDKQLGGQHYIMKGNTPCCLNCFDAMYSEKCNKCHEPIKFNDGQMTYEKLHWHATDKCFSCYSCNTSLLGHPFLPRKGNIYCSTLCFKAENSTEDNLSPFKELENESMKELKTGQRLFLHNGKRSGSSSSNVFKGSSNLCQSSKNSLQNIQSNRAEALYKTSHFPLRAADPAEYTSGTSENLTFHKSCISGVVKPTSDIQENAHEDLSDTSESQDILLMPCSVIDIKETKTIFQRSILKKYSSFVENTSYDKKENIIFTSSKTNDILQIELENSRLGYESEYFSSTKDQAATLESYPKKQLKVRFQCIIPEIRYANSISRPPDCGHDNSDSESSCSTCSSSSFEDLSTYKIPQRRDYGGIRISYIPNDAMAIARRHQEAYSNFCTKKSPNDKHCVIS